MPKLIEIIQQALTQHVSLASIVEDSYREMTLSKSGKLSTLNSKKKSLLVRKGNINDRKNQLLRDYIAKALNQEEYFLLKELYEEQYSGLEKELIAVQQQISEVQTLSDSAKKWVNALREFGQGKPITNELIKEMIQRIDLYQQGNQVDVKITFRFQDTFQQIWRQAGDND
jgi:hypothetical protein